MKQRIPSFFDGTEFDPGIERRKSQRKSRLSQDLSLGCESCSLNGKANTHCMEPYGSGDLGILLVGEAPGKSEDRRGIPFIGKSGQLLADSFADCGVNIDRDCVRTNIVSCRPPDNRDPSKKEIRCCRRYLEDRVRDFGPSLIITFGRIACESILDGAPFSPGIARFNGKILWSENFDCWVACCYHPSLALRNNFVGVSPRFFKRSVQSVLAQYVELPDRPETIDTSYELVASVKQLEKLRDHLYDTNSEFNFDYETTGLSPWNPDIELLSVAVSTADTNWWIDFRQIGLGKAHDAWKDILASPNPKTIQNSTFEIVWSVVRFSQWPRNIVLDTMLSKHIIDSRSMVTSLGWQAYEYFGYAYKDEVDRSDLGAESKHALAIYNVSDSRLSFDLAEAHRRQMLDSRASDFFHRCIQVCQRMKIRGIQVDMDRVHEMRDSYSARIVELKDAIESMPIVTNFARRKGSFNYFSGPQIQEFLFEYLALTPQKETKSGRPSTDESVILAIAESDSEAAEFCACLTEVRKRKKIVDTYLTNFIELADPDGFLHPDFDLHTTQTFRSSSSNPNFQNIPKRDPLTADVRKVFVPRNDLFIEIDYAAAEVRVLAMYSEDSKLCGYIRDNVDFHSDWAEKIYNVSEKDVDPKEWKGIRFNAKNTWTFAMFYGSYYKARQRDFANKGLIKTEAFFKRLETEFWDEFRGVKRWQEHMADFYERHGYVETLLGFRRQGPMDQNRVINTPIQGTAFHALLDGAYWTDVDMTDANMESVCVAQIHDSLIIDAKESELSDIIEIAKHRLTDRRWDWEIVPLEIEIEAGPNFGELDEIQI